MPSPRPKKSAVTLKSNARAAIAAGVRIPPHAPVTLLPAFLSARRARPAEDAKSLSIANKTAHPDLVPGVTNPHCHLSPISVGPPPDIIPTSPYVNPQTEGALWQGGKYSRLVTCARTAAPPTVPPCRAAIQLADRRVSSLGQLYPQHPIAGNTHDRVLPPPLVRHPINARVVGRDLHGQSHTAPQHSVRRCVPRLWHARRWREQGRSRAPSIAPCR